MIYHLPKVLLCRIFDYFVVLNIALFCFCTYLVVISLNSQASMVGSLVKSIPSF